MAWSWCQQTQNFGIWDTPIAMSDGTTQELFLDRTNSFIFLGRRNGWMVYLDRFKMVEFFIWWKRLVNRSHRLILWDSFFWVSFVQAKTKTKRGFVPKPAETANKLGDDLDFSGKWKMWSYKKGGSRSLENVRHPWCCEKRIALQDSKDLFWIRTGILPYLYSPMCRTFCTFQQTCQTNWTFNIWTKTYCISYILIYYSEREVT